MSKCRNRITASWKKIKKKDKNLKFIFIAVKYIICLRFERAQTYFMINQTIRNNRNATLLANQLKK